MLHRFLAPAALLVAMLLASACGNESAADASSANASAPTVVVTTNILGDVVAQIVGDQATVVTIMPVGADPHDFQASAKQVAEINDADALISNGGGFEEGLIDIIAAATDAGVVGFEATSAVSTIEGGHSDHDDHGDEDHADEEHHDDDEDHDDEDHADEHGDDDHGDDEDHDEHADDDHGGDEDHDEHADEEHDDDHADEHANDDHGDDHTDEEHHDDEEHDDEDKHDDHDDEDKHDEDHDDHGHDEGVDPHFFTDPQRMEVATQAIADFLTENLDGIDASVVAANTADYLEQLTALDERIAAAVGALPSERRVLVTSHEVFGYFAERYDFTVVGTVVPSGSTADGSSAGALAELADVIRDQDVPAIFSDTSSSDELAQTLAAEVGAVEVIALYSESLGAADSDGATYIEMMQANADRITDALAP